MRIFQVGSDSKSIILLRTPINVRHLAHLSSIRAAAMNGQRHFMLPVLIKFEPFSTMVNRYQSVRVRQKILSLSTKNIFWFGWCRTMRKRKWKSERRLGARNTSMAQLLTECGAKNSIGLRSTIGLSVVQHWNCLRSTCPDTIALCSRRNNQHKRLTGGHRWDLRRNGRSIFIAFESDNCNGVCVDDERGWRLCVVSTPSQTDATYSQCEKNWIIDIYGMYSTSQG